MNIDKFTKKLQDLLAIAQQTTYNKQQQFVDMPHLMHALINNDCLAKRVLSSQSGNLYELQHQINTIITRLPTVEGGDTMVEISKSVAQVLQKSEILMKDFSDQYIATDTVLLACLENDQIKDMFVSSDFNLEKIISTINTSRKNTKVDSEDFEGESEVLKKYTIDLTKLAEDGKLDPVIGRDSEIRRAIQVLQRRTKNNPALIGDPGVGKTAIAEGLAQRIINNEIPEGLKDKKLLQLDLSAMVAGSKFRGEFEERLKNVLKEITKHKDEFIIFIDELHTMVGAGKAEGSIDAGNMLKPALARGELRCIGATTLDEYRQYIEKDAALERRFQKVMINQPSVEDTVAILRGLKERYEIHHGVTVTDTALISAANLSARYITDRNLPDKAIDLIDEAASLIRMEIDSKPEEMDRLDRKIIQLKIEIEALKKDSDIESDKRKEDLEKNLSELTKQYESLDKIWVTEKNLVLGAKNLKSKLESAKQDLENARRKNDLAKMSELQYGLIPEIENEIKSSDKSNAGELELLRNKVTDDIVADIVSRWTGIPVNTILQSEKERLLKIEESLSRFVIGQETAISVIANAIRRSRSGIADPSKPNGVFLFLGPTGVGKTTTLAKLAANLAMDRTEVVMVTADTFRVAAIPQLETYAEIIGLPVELALSPQGAQDAINTYTDRDMIFVDTVGRSPNHQIHMAELRSYIQAIRPTEVHLTLSATVKFEDLVRIVDRYKELVINKTIFTKLDEAVNFGVLVNVAQKVNKRLSFLTTGQEVPHQIEPSTGDRIAGLILGHEAVNSRAVPIGAGAPAEDGQ